MNVKQIKNSLLTGLTAVYLSASAQSPIPFPQPSPASTLTQSFATSKIEVNYSRPSMKGRKVFGDVVPFGKFWRTGANSATVVTFGEDVNVNGVELKAGKYGLYTFPGEQEWAVVLSKDLNVTDEGSYKKENDAVRVSVKPARTGETVETFTIDVTNLRNTSCDLVLKWEQTQIVLNITADIDARLTKQIADVMAKDSRPYYSSANYYYENGKDLNQALVWVNKAVEANPKAFWVLLLKAKIQKGLKDYTGAIATSQQSMDLAKASNSDPYIKQNEQLQAEIKALPDYKEAPAKKKK